MLLLVCFTIFCIGVIIYSIFCKKMECTICLNRVSNGWTLSCGHEFCIGCISVWLLRNDTCPNCRAVIEDQPEVQIAVDQHLVAHETFYAALQIFVRRGTLRSTDLEALSRPLATLENREPEMLHRGRWLGVTRTTIPVGMEQLRNAFPENSRSRGFALNILSGQSLGLFRTVSGMCPRRIYGCIRCNSMVYSNVTDLVRHMSTCQGPRRRSNV